MDEKNKKLLKAAKRLRNHCRETYCIDCIFLQSKEESNTEYSCRLDEMITCWDLSGLEEKIDGK
jgi:hypothetical protein